MRTTSPTRVTEPVSTSSALTLFAAKEFSLGADAPQGIAILRGCPLSANVEIMPSAAESAAHIRWQTRRLGRNGTYGNWEDCRFERTPETATILTPAAGGIYQLQAVVSDGTGGQALRTYRGGRRRQNRPLQERRSQCGRRRGRTVAAGFAQLCTRVLGAGGIRIDGCLSGAIRIC